MERRISAILAADMVGYSRLMEADEIGTLERQKAHRRDLINPAFEEYHGRIVKEMGDGILVEFPSVVEAVQCAATIQKAMPGREAEVVHDRRIAYRIGINLGDIVVEGDDIYGDGVNVAARLEQMAEPGGICISGTAYDQMRSTVEVGYEALGEVNVKNIERPIRAYKVLIDPARIGELIEPAGVTSANDRGRRVNGIIAAVVLLALFAGGGWWWSRQPDFEPANPDKFALQMPDKPSIAVLPFDNFSGEREQGYFADGMTEDLITDLSKLSGVFVISRNSSWSYKGKPVKPQQVAEELGVRYVLEGSVRRQGDQVRINAQLIDAVGGQHLWAERYDGALGDVFKLQDEVIEKIVAALAVNLTKAEQAEVGRAETGSPQAYDALLQGLDRLRQDTEEGTLAAITFFEKAIDLDADYGRAYAALAAAHWRIASSSWFAAAEGGFSRSWEKLNEYLEKAMAADTALGHATMAEVFAQEGRFDEAFVQINRAMAIAPNESDNFISKAKILNAKGRAAEAEVAARWAMRLDPRYSPEYLRVLARSLFHQKRYEEAIQTLQRVVSQQSDVIEDYATLASSFGHLGRMEEVPAMAEKYNEIAVPAGYDPLTVQELGWWWYGDIFDYDNGYREHLQEGLRKAGIPEGAGTDLSRQDYVRFISKVDGEYEVRGARKVDAAAAKDLFDEGSAKFIDVRSTTDHGWGYIPGAINLSLVTDLSKPSLLAVADIDDPVIFYCHGEHCPYSAYASAKALAWGFTDVYYFAGGFPAWQGAGYPTKSVATD
ncbi:guanylyl cyclase [Stappia sp. GBMRC 2046]|uniref:Guanylyl cyclase n=1 Tax=Stappia sediminis TaxID=2692190 RepID=A0A7X3SA06_9HYPH|nr:rhodanese-like domain-containing protein [Stappia sediminis]MXN67394.1 guanylyl cyclase [Stappia sediminis]